MSDRASAPPPLDYETPKKPRRGLRLSDPVVLAYIFASYAGVAAFVLADHVLPDGSGAWPNPESVAIAPLLAPFAALYLVLGLAAAVSEGSFWSALPVLVTFAVSIGVFVVSFVGLRRKKRASE